VTSDDGAAAVIDDVSDGVCVATSETGATAIVTFSISVSEVTSIASATDVIGPDNVMLSSVGERVVDAGICVVPSGCVAVDPPTSAPVLSEASVVSGGTVGAETIADDAEADVASATVILVPVT
jgi:hypothetical protein